MKDIVRMLIGALWWAVVGAAIFLIFDVDFDNIGFIRGLFGWMLMVLVLPLHKNVSNYFLSLME